ncbi:hypothetical protein ACQQ2N_03200 [Dokdonella sp. MW10]|uniref:hypothetical protein n=1 Tax=Dokdonella sp. MW10 TaxID=2992926 RepID=UPI003F7E42FF
MTDLWGPIDKAEWRSTPHVAGRAAREEDVRAGKAVFYVQGESKHDPIRLPCCAFQRLDDGSEQPVVVIQAEISPHGTLFGVRPLSGGNGVCTAAELRMVPEGFGVGAGA